MDGRSSKTPREVEGLGPLKGLLPQLSNSWVSNMLLSEAFASYARDVIIFRNQSSKTEEHHFVACRSLITYIGDIDISRLTFNDVRDWKMSLEKRKLSQNTIRGYLNKLRVVLTYLKKRGINCMDPEFIPLPPRINNIPMFITPEEVKQLIKAVAIKQRGYPACNRIRNQAIISLLYASGVRIGELCALNRNSIYDNSFTVFGKGNKVRLCFIDRRTDELLKKYLSTRIDNNQALFLANQTKDRIKPGNIQKMMNAGWKKAGINKPVHPHSLRHSYATNLLRNNANMRYVQELLGHSSLQTTQMYTQVVNEDLKAVYERHHSI